LIPYAVSARDFLVPDNRSSSPLAPVSQFLRVCLFVDFFQLLSVLWPSVAYPGFPYLISNSLFFCRQPSHYTLYLHQVCLPPRRRSYPLVKALEFPFLQLRITGFPFRSQGTSYFNVLMSFSTDLSPEVGSPNLCQTHQPASLLAFFSRLQHLSVNLPCVGHKSCIVLLIPTIKFDMQRLYSNRTTVPV